MELQSGVQYEATVKDTDHKLDLALIKTEPNVSLRFEDFHQLADIFFPTPPHVFSPWHILFFFLVCFFSILHSFFCLFSSMPVCMSVTIFINYPAVFFSPSVPSSTDAASGKLISLLVSEHRK